MMAPWLRVLLMTVVVLAVLVGCGRGTSDLERWMADVRQQPIEPIEPIPPMRTAEVVTYEAMDLRDPFRAGRGPVEEEQLAVANGNGLRPDPDRRREYLEEFPLDTLQMVGTLAMGEVLYALIRDNENVVHRVREGNYIGRNHGEIISVEPGRIELRELIQDGRGGWMERRARVAMAEQ